MNVAIVGSRRRPDKENVTALVDSLSSDDVVVSGGCQGVDSWAEERATQRGLQTLIYRPDLSDCRFRLEYTKAYYARNRQIAEAADIVYAFVSSDRTGGTENTIGYAKALGKEVVLR